MEQQLRIVQNVEVTDLVRFINKKNQVHQRVLLDAIEEILGKDSDEFRKIRKLVLDNTNDFSRSVVKVIFGDTFEGIIK